MELVRHILEHKKQAQIHTIDQSASVLEATRRMNEHRIGALVVMDGDRIAGIFTERDVLRRVVAQELAPASVPVRDVMTRQIICCSPDTPLDEAASIMRDRRIRHLPVVDDTGHLAGFISIGDLNAYHAASQQAKIRFLHDYLYGRG